MSSPIASSPIAPSPIEAEGSLSLEEGVGMGQQNTWSRRGTPTAAVSAVTSPSTAAAASATAAAVDTKRGKSSINRLEKLKNSLLQVLKFLVLLFLFLNGVRVALNTFQFREIFNSDTRNNLCSKAPLKTPHGTYYPPMFADFVSGESATGEAATICDKMPPTMQFKKFIWFLTDGLPVKYSKDLFKPFSDHMVLFPIDLPGPKYSHAIYTSYLTGQLPTNYQGRPIKGDHLVKSMKRSPKMGPLTYIGPKWSFLAISGTDQETKQFFDHIDIQEEPLDQPHDRAYRFFFKDDATKKNFYSTTLENLKKDGGSLFTHSAIFDHMVHGVFRAEHVDTRWLDIIAGRIAKDMAGLKDWIDQNPEYLLILSSDHGTDDVSNGYVLHGYSTNGNEGYIMMYNPALHKHQSRIDVVDVAPTIAKYLDHVDIPADNIGMVHSVFPVGDSQRYVYRANALKQNIAQLCDTVVRRGIVGGCNTKTTRNILDMEIDVSDLPKAAKQLEDLEAHAKELKGLLYNLVSKPWHWVTYYALFALAIIIVLLFRYNGAMFREFRFSSSIPQTLLKFGFFVPLYFGAFINALFSWDTWKNVFNDGAPFIIWQATLAFCLLYFFVAHVIVKFFVVAKGKVSMEATQSQVSAAIPLPLDGNDGTLEADDEGQSSSSTGKQSLAQALVRDGEWLMDSVSRSGIHRIFLNILIDLMLYGLHSMFQKQWKWAVGNRLLQPLPYTLLIILILQVLDIPVIKLIVSPFSACLRLVRRQRGGGSGGSGSGLLGSMADSAQEEVGMLVCLLRVLPHLIVSFLMLGLVALFELTSALRSDSQEVKNSFSKYYCVFDFHVFYFGFMSLALLYSLYLLFLAPASTVSAQGRRQSHQLKLVLPATLYAFMLMRDMPHFRLLTILFNMQYLHLIAPFLDGICQLATQAQVHLVNAIGFSASNDPQRSKLLLYTRLLQQATVLFIINHFYFWFVTAREEKLNIDAHPFAGAVGMHSHQAHPSFNAFQMAFEKWHYALLYAVYIQCALVGSFQQPALPSMTTSRKKQQQESQKESISQGHHFMTDLFLTLFSLLLFNGHWFLQLLLCFISMYHGFQETVVYLITIGALGGLINLMLFCDRFKRVAIVKRIRKVLARKGAAAVAQAALPLLPQLPGQKQKE